jgi:hypothetical protein
VDGFATCSGLPATVDCSDVPESPAACLTDGEPNGTCDDNSVESCQSGN